MSGASMVTWENQVPVYGAESLFSSLRASGLPLANAGAANDDEGESDQSKIVCVVSVIGETAHALVACPSGVLFRFEPAIFEKGFWEFAARYYYIVTGCMADRNLLSELTGVPAKEIKGKAVSRVKGDGVSNMTLDGLLELMGCLEQQSSLF